MKAYHGAILFIWLFEILNQFLLIMFNDCPGSDTTFPETILGPKRRGEKSIATE